MPVVQQSVFEIGQGRHPGFLEAASRARAIQQRHTSGPIAAFQAFIAGPDSSLVTYAIWHQDPAAFGRFADSLNADPEWQAFWAKENLTAASPVARLVSNVVAMDVPGVESPLPAQPVPGSIIARASFQPLPGRMGEVLTHVAMWRAIAARLGIVTRATQVAVGGSATGMIVVSTLHPTMSDYVKVLAAVQADAEFQALGQSINGPGSPSTPLGQTVNIFLPI